MKLALGLGLVLLLAITSSSAGDDNTEVSADDSRALKQYLWKMTQNIPWSKLTANWNLPSTVSGNATSITKLSGVLVGTFLALMITLVIWLIIYDKDLAPLRRSATDYTSHFLSLSSRQRRSLLDDVSTKVFDAIETFGSNL